MIRKILKIIFGKKEKKKFLKFKLIYKIIQNLIILKPKINKIIKITFFTIILYFKIFIFTINNQIKKNNFEQLLIIIIII